MDNLRKGILIKNNVAVGAVGDKYFSSTAIGVIQAFSGNTIPNGYLLANGASYKVTDYPDLYAVIGNTYGGDTENFNVPNLVDKFIQGSTTSGEEKEAGLPNITGTFYHDPNVRLSLSGAFSYTVGSFINLQNDDANKNSGYVSFDASKSNPIYGNSTTVQPPALTMVYIIKAFHTNEGVDSGVSDDVIKYVEGEIAKVETDMDKVVKYPDWSNQQTISLTEITVDQDVYIELNQLSSSPIEGLKINGKEVSISDAENGLYSTRFSGYVKKGSFVSYPYLTNANIVRVFPLV